MGAWLTYLSLEIKRAFKILPYFFAGAIVLACLLGTVAFSASRMVYKDKAAERIQVGVVLPEEDLLAEQLVRMLSTLDSVNSICDFEYVDKQEGMDLLKHKKLHILMIVPEGMTEGIINGANFPAEIMFPDSTGIEGFMFRELADAGARTLSVAQAGIYAGGEYLIIHNLGYNIPDMERDLNKIYLKYALSRSDCYDSTEISVAGDLTMVQYYGISCSAMFLLMCGVPAALLLKSKNTAMKQRLFLLGLGNLKVMAADVLSVTVLLLSVCISGLVILTLSGVISLSWLGISLTILLCLSGASLITSVYKLAGNPIGGVMILFSLTIVMSFCAGGFIPSVFLPDTIVSLSRWMPVTYMIQVMKGIVTGSVLWQSIGGMLGLTILWFGIAAGIRRGYG